MHDAFYGSRVLGNVDAVEFGERVEQVFNAPAGLALPAIAPVFAVFIEPEELNACLSGSNSEAS